MLHHLIKTWDTIIYNLAKTQVLYIKLLFCGKIPVQASTDRSCELTMHFPTEEECSISWI